MNIFVSVLFMFTTIILAVCLILVPKYEKSVNLIDEIVINSVLIICYMALMAGLLSLCKISVNLISLSIFNILLVFVCIGIIIKCKRKQDIYICKEDLVICCLNIVLIICIQNHIFVNLKSGYSNGDSAVHFQQAMSVFRNEGVSGMYFTPLFNATVIRVCSPFLQEIEYYKGMIIADSFTFLLLLEMLYIVIKEKLVGIREKIVGWVLCLLCFCGYPLYSYMIGGFLYLTTALMLFCFLLLLLYRYCEEKCAKAYGFISIMLVLLCISVTYMFFTPILYPIVLIIIFINNFLLKKKSLYGCIKNEFCLFIFPSLWTLYFSFQYWYNGSSTIETDNIVDATRSITHSTSSNVGLALTQNGGMYGRVYSDFLIFLPLIIFMIIHIIQERKYIINEVFMLLYILATLFCFCLCISGRLSGYYYYKIYFPMWMLAWICFSDLQVIFRKQKVLFITYFLTCVMICMLSMFRVEFRIYEKYPSMRHAEEISSEMEIYSVNYARWSQWEFDKWWVSDAQKELFAYVVENLNDGKNSIPLIIDFNDTSRILVSRWYAGMTGHYFDYNKLNDINLLIDELIQNNKYVVLLYDTDFYLEHGNRFDTFKIVYENEAGKIVELY